MTSTAVEVAAPPRTRLHPETTALLAKWKGAKRICITTSELSATQLTPFIADRVPSIELRSEFGELNERQLPTSPAPVSNVKLVKWTFLMALLVGELFPDSELNYSIIVNDFPLPLDARAELHAVWPRYFPAPLIRIARDLGFAVDVGQDVVRLSHKNGQVRPLRLVFETSLRNAAKKGLARMARDGRVREASKKELEYSPDATRVKVRSTASFRYVPKARVSLTTERAVPLCSAVVMHHFIRQAGEVDLFLNVADMAWTCGYRAGAEAFLNLFDDQVAFVNLLFDEPGDSQAFYDVYERQ